MMFNVFGKKLFGVKGERLKKNIFVCLVLFWGLKTAQLHIEIGTFVLYLMSAVVSAGLMWQAFSSEDNKVNMNNMLMLPFENYKFNMAYTGAIALYTMITKTGILLAVAFAVTQVTVNQVIGCIVCIANAMFMTAVIFTWKKLRMLGFVWAGCGILFLYLCHEKVFFLPIMVVHFGLVVMMLLKANSYSFGVFAKGKIRVRSNNNYSIWRYLYRYMVTHKNYMANTLIMWGVACLLPGFMKGMDSKMAIPISFAILTLNTPICILLSCDASLERAVRFLPGQKRMFCLSYCMFIFICNLMADVVFLVSWEIQAGGMDIGIVLTAIFFALQSAIFSVVLEWKHPLRKWKIESDLWHHPRKYIVPLIMVLFAGLISSVPGSVTWVYVALVAELIAWGVVISE